MDYGQNYMGCYGFLSNLVGVACFMFCALTSHDIVTLMQSILWDNDIKSTKHTLKEMIMHHSCLELPEGKAVIKCDTPADLA
jgi:hypothetical protein